MYIRHGLSGDKSRKTKPFKSFYDFYVAAPMPVSLHKVIG